MDAMNLAHWLTVRQAAARLGLSKATLDIWRSRGEGPPFARFGRAVRYHSDALDAWAAERVTDPSATELAVTA